MILPKLRTATRCEHERLETRIDLLGRVWTPAFYRSLLQKFYGFYAVLEPPLFAHPEWKPQLDTEKRRKTGLLRRDLMHLSLSETEIEALPRCEQVPPMLNFAQAMGCAYVLEGSTLGGQIIMRHLQRELDIAPERGGAFFYAYGPQTGPMWREFTTVLDAYTLNEDAQTEVLESARATFGTLEAWLSDIL